MMMALISTPLVLNMGKVLNLEYAYMKGNWVMIGIMITGFTEKVSANFKEYVRENWGAPFILGFILLLLVAAVSLLMDFVALADSVAVIAYYALIVGVALQLVCFMKYSKKSGEKA